MNKYIENLFKVLFENDFEGIKEETTMPIAVVTLAWSSTFLFLAKNTMQSGFAAELKYITGFCFYVSGIFLVWFMTAIFFEFVTKIFGRAGKIRTLLTLTAYSCLPYLFIAPCELIKKFSDMGYFFGTKLEILLFLWVMFIYSQALRKTYDLENTSSLMLIFLPAITLIFAFIWLIGGAFNLGYIYSV